MLSTVPDGRGKVEGPMVDGVCFRAALRRLCRVHSAARPDAMADVDLCP